MASGPLAGTRIIEIAGIGPGPFCAMMLADLGADVIRVDRARRRAGGDPGRAAGRPAQPGPALGRRRPQVRPTGVEVVLDAGRGGRRAHRGRSGPASPSASASVPTSASRATRARLRAHDRLGPGRPLRPGRRPRHQLHRPRRRPRPIGREGEAPVPPLNLVGDFGGGGMLLAFGVLAGLLDAARTGRGPGGRRRHGRRRRLAHDDVPRLPGDGHLGGRAGHEHARHRRPLLRRLRVRRRQVRLDRLDRAAVLRRCCSSTPASTATELPPPDGPGAVAGAQGAAGRRSSSTKTRDEWCEIMEGTDVCFAPVLSHGRGAEHPHNVARGTFARGRRASSSRRRRPASAARRARSSARRAHAGQHTDEVLADWGLDADRIAALKESGAVG